MAVARTMGKSECGVVIKRVDRERWITISRIAVPLKVGAAMAAEMMGCVRAHGNPGSGFSTNVCVFRMPTDVLTQF